MILKFPTGLYSSVIPQSPSDSGNITYLISGSSPPTSPLNFTHIPAGVESVKRAASVSKRSSFGLLSRTNLSSVGSVTISNKKKFEVGDDLEFTDAKQASVAPIQKTNNIVHNTNYLDFEAMGLTADEIADIQNSALVEFNKLLTEVNSIRVSRENSDRNAAETQKEINEVTKAINATKHLNNQSIIDKLNIKLVSLNDKLNAFVQESVDYTSQYESATSKMTELKQLIR